MKWRQETNKSKLIKSLKSRRVSATVRALIWLLMESILKIELSTTKEQLLCAILSILINKFCLMSIMIIRKEKIIKKFWEKDPNNFFQNHNWTKNNQIVSEEI